MSPTDDPNSTAAGARQRLGPFWIEEPRWYWAASAAVLMAFVVLFALLMVFDPP